MERIATYTVNAQITSTQLNDLQDVTVGLISGANNNVLSAAGCDGCEWQSTADLAPSTQVKVDATRDWRDRVLTVLYYAPSGSNTEPGGVNDTDYDYDITSLRKGYAGRGGLDAGSADPTNGNPPVVTSTPPGSWALKVDVDVYLYASTVDGSLWLYNDTAGTIKIPILSITATAPTGLRP